MAATAPTPQPTSRATCTDRVSVQVVAIPGHCWRCHKLTWPIAGVFVPRVDGRGRLFLEFSDVAHRLAIAAPRQALRALGTGPIKIRRSRTIPEGYLSNGCVHCDAIQGNFPLHEDLAEFQAGGGNLRDLIVGTLSLPARRR